MDLLFLKLFFTFFITVKCQQPPRQIMPVNAVQSQFNPFFPQMDYQFFQLQRQHQQQQPFLQRSQGLPQNPMDISRPMFQQQQQQQSRSLPLQPPLNSNFKFSRDISNPLFQQQQQQQQTRQIPFQVSFGQKTKSEEQQASTPYNGGGLVPVTEKLMDSNSEKLPPSSVGNTKKDSFRFIVQQAPTQTVPPETLPPFLQGTPQEIIDEFKRILRQPQLPYDDKLKQVGALVETLSPDRQQLFRNFMNQQQLPSALSSTLPPSQFIQREPSRTQARWPQKPLQSEDDYFLRISRILQDESIPENDRWKQIVEIYGEVEPRIKNEYPFDVMAY